MIRVVKRELEILMHEPGRSRYSQMNNKITEITEVHATFARINSKIFLEEKNELKSQLGESLAFLMNYKMSFGN